MHKTSTSAPHRKQRRTAITQAAFAALGLGAATITFTGLPSANAAPLPDGCSADGQAVTCIYNGSVANWTVPNGTVDISSITFRVQGDSGDAATNGGGAGGRGAVVTGTVAVVPGDQFNLTIPDALAGTGNGNGGAGGASTSVVRVAPGVALIAGGGGGGGAAPTATGGNAGTFSPAQTGLGNAPGFGLGGGPDGPAGETGGNAANGGGGGGSGSTDLVGTKGGGGGGNAGGGGGGASFQQGTTNTSATLGAAGEGPSVRITYTDPDLPAAPDPDDPDQGGSEPCDLPGVIRLGSGNDTFTGTGASEVIDGGSGNDEIDGGGGNDIICGGSGNDVLEGGDGDDTLIGESGDDELIGGAGADTTDGGSGTDTETP